MRQFGGSESLPDLTELLDDTEPQVQREAVRAILNVGTDAAYRILEQALTGGTTRSRDAIMQSIGLVRDERATPLFVYILGTSIIAARSSRSTCGRSNRSARCAIRAASRRCATRCTRANGGRHGARRCCAARPRPRSGASARPKPSPCSRKRRRRDRGASDRPRAGSSRPAARGAPPGRFREKTTRDGAALSAGRRAVAAIRRVAAIGAALFAGPSDHRAEPRVAVDRGQLLHSLQPTVVIGIVGDEVIVGRGKHVR